MSFYSYASFLWLHIFKYVYKQDFKTNYFILFFFMVINFQKWIWEEYMYILFIWFFFMVIKF